ncbi:Aftiphilin [Manis pentadactyla]|nr:Aftiphilin [Manis pentadactyla]
MQKDPKLSILTLAGLGCTDNFNWLSEKPVIDEGRPKEEWIPVRHHLILHHKKHWPLIRNIREDYYSARKRHQADIPRERWMELEI